MEEVIANVSTECLLVANGRIANCEWKQMMPINCERKNCELRMEVHNAQELRTEELRIANGSTECLGIAN